MVQVEQPEQMVHQVNPARQDLHRILIMEKPQKTGDPSGLFGWLGLAVTSLGAGIGGVSLKRKKREDEEA